MGWQERMSSYKGTFLLHIKVEQSATLQRKKKPNPMPEQNNGEFHVPVTGISVGRHAVSKNNSFYVNAFRLECGQNLDPNQSIVACKSLLPFSHIHFL